MPSGVQRREKGGAEKRKRGSGEEKKGVRRRENFVLCAAEAEPLSKFNTRRDKVLAIIVLSVDPTLLYLVGDPTDPFVVWTKLADQFQKKMWANKLHLRKRL